MNSLKSDFCIFVKETKEEIIKLYTSKVRKTIFFNCVIGVNGFNGESVIYSLSMCHAIYVIHASNIYILIICMLTLPGYPGQFRSPVYKIN